VSEIVCEPFKRGIPVSYSTFGPLDISAVGFLSRSFLGLISLVKITGVRVPDVEHQPLAPLIEALYWRDSSLLCVVGGVFGETKNVK